MPEHDDVRARLQRTERYLRRTLLPFWIERAADRTAGGYLSYFDRDGRPTGETTKTLLMQLRLIYGFARAHREGYGSGACAELATHGADFVLEHYGDREHGGWFWIADRDGRPTFEGKIGYGQLFAMYAFGEYWRATGDRRGREAMERTYEVVEQRMADPRHGGYFEVMQRDWRPAPGPHRGGDRKSLDVHLHAMEALTQVFEVTGQPAHRQRLEEIMALVLGRMLNPRHGTGQLQFDHAFRPLRAIRYRGVAWGSDAEPEAGSFPLSTTSYGHDLELAWLLLHAADVLGVPRAHYGPAVRRLCESCLRAGLDHEHGGVYVDGPPDTPPDCRHKQFWQQAEVMVGMLDAAALFGDERYWRAFVNVHDFVFGKMIDWAGGGEWFALCDRDGTPLWDYQGHEWKICYHTVRGMIEVVRRLRAMAADGESGGPGRTG